MRRDFDDATLKEDVKWLLDFYARKKKVQELYWASITY